jgi:hypothetical protein
MKLILTTLAALAIGAGSLKAQSLTGSSNTEDLKREISGLRRDITDLTFAISVNAGGGSSFTPPRTLEYAEYWKIQDAKTAAMYKELAEKKAKDAERSKQWKAEWDERMKAQKEFLSDTTKSGAYEKYRNTIEKLNR